MWANRQTDPAQRRRNAAAERASDRRVQKANAELEALAAQAGKRAGEKPIGKSKQAA